jgi:tetratricopeptide (TPR) repeat protein
MRLYSLTPKAALSSVIAFLVLLLFSPLCFARQSIQASAPTTDVEEDAARFYLFLGDGELAERHLNPLLQKHPHDSKALMYRGQARILQSRYENAIEDFRQAIKSGYDHAEALEAIAECHLRLKQPEQCIRDCNQLIELVPKSYGAFEKRASAFALAGKRELERKDLEVLSTLRPSGKDLIASALREADGFEQDKALSRAIEVDPRAVDGWLRLAIHQLQFDRPESTLLSCNRAAKLDPDYLASYYERARAFYSIGQYRPAIDDLNLVLRKAPDCRRAWEKRALCYAKMKDDRHAIQDFSKALELLEHSESKPELQERVRPDIFMPTETLYYYRAAAYERSENYSKALADYDRIIEIAARRDPSRLSDLHSLKASIYSKLRNYRAQEKEWTAVIEGGAPSENAYLKRSICYYRLGQYQKAVKDLGFIGEESSLSGHAHYLRGRCLAKMGKQKLAQDELKEARNFGYKPLSDELDISSRTSLAAEKEKPRQRP